MTTDLRGSWLLLSAMIMAGCTQGATSTGSVPTALGTGRLAIQIVDAPTHAYQEVVVTISKVTAHSAEAGWVTISDVPATMDLLKLQSTGLLFGKGTIPPGTVTQLRLYTDPAGPQYVTLPDGSHVDLKVPSGPQSGIKIHGPFKVSACEETTITLDFDPETSVFAHAARGGDLWLLRPVIRAKGIEVAQVGCEAEPAGEDASVAAPAADAGAPAATNLATGSPCSQNGECLSELCVGFCAPGGPGAPCQAGTDCVSGVCLPSGDCGTGVAVVANGPCVANSDCLSNVCTSGLCEPGSQGAPCVVDADCLSVLTCHAGNCSPPVL